MGSHFHQQKLIGFHSPISRTKQDDRPVLPQSSPPLNTYPHSLSSHTLSTQEVHYKLDNKLYQRYQEPLIWGKYSFLYIFSSVILSLPSVKRLLIQKVTQARGPTGLPSGKVMPMLSQASWLETCLLVQSPLLPQVFCFSQQRRYQPPLSTLGRLSLTDRLLYYQKISSFQLHHSSH